MSLKVISLNIEGRRHLEQVEQLIIQEKPDVMCVQELLEQDVARLEAATKFKCYFTPSVILTKASLAQLPWLGKWGVAILVPADAQLWVEYYHGSADKLPNFTGPNSGLKLVVIVRFTFHGQQFTIGTTHFTWTGDGKPSKLQSKTLDKMLSLLENYPELILCGDFNAPRGGPIFDKLATVYRDNIPPDVSTTIDPNLHSAGPLQLVVDGLFTSKHFTAKDVEVRSGVSDHQAIIARVEPSGF